MSALSVALAAHQGLPRPHSVPTSSSASCESPRSSCSTDTLSDLSSAESSVPPSTPPPPPALSLVVPEAKPRTRSNEHLCVFLPRHLWKADSAASHCDRFFCDAKFSLLERRHHCRKCGGIFCAACSAYATPLLDTTKLAFWHPPRGVPIQEWHSEESPVREARVCVDCYEQIHGSCSTQGLIASGMQSATSEPALSLASSSSSASILSVGSPSASSSRSASPQPHRRPRSHLSSHSSASTYASAVRRPASLNGLCTAASHGVVLPEEKSYGELDAYPLRRASLLCKATGGGRWEPKPSPVLAHARLPLSALSSLSSSPDCPSPLSPHSSVFNHSHTGIRSTRSERVLGKALYEQEMEREEERKRVRRENPVVVDGEFRYRFQNRCQEEGEGWPGSGSERRVREREVLLATF